VKNIQSKRYKQQKTTTITTKTTITPTTTITTRNTNITLNYELKISLNNLKRPTELNLKQFREKHQIKEIQKANKD